MLRDFENTTRVTVSQRADLPASLSSNGRCLEKNANNNWVKDSWFFVRWQGQQKKTTTNCEEKKIKEINKAPRGRL